MADIEAEFAGKGYGDFKKSVADAVCSTLEQIQKRYAEVTAGDMIEKTLADGRARAEKMAAVKLDQVQRAIGMEIIG
jgi:tryptophanyl-tRNA synthetase